MIGRSESLRRDTILRDAKCVTVVSDVGECLVVLFPNNKVRILYEERDIDGCFIVFSSLLLIRLLLVRLLLVRLLLVRLLLVRLLLV